MLFSTGPEQTQGLSELHKGSWTVNEATMPGVVKQSQTEEVNSSDYSGKHLHPSNSPESRFNLTLQIKQ